MPNNLEPLSYNLHLRPNIYDDNPENFYFSGDVSIRMTVKQDTDRVTVHAKMLNVPKESIKVLGVQSNEQIDVLKTEYEERPKEFLHIDLVKPLQKFEEYTVYLQFEGNITNDLIGLYYSTYTNDDGKDE